MRNLIYIVDEESLDDNVTEDVITQLTSTIEEVETDNPLRKQKQSITTKIRKENNSDNQENSKNNINLANIYMGVAAILFPLPISVLVNAAPAAYSLYQLFNKKEDKDISVENLKKSANSFDKYLKKISLTPEMALKKEYKFQPGHPQINIAYIRHPLSDDNNTKNNLYIPADAMDDILLQEREAEMIRILVMLGATRIEFRKESVAKALHSATAKLEAGLPTGTGQAEVKIDAESFGEGSDKRVITLAGRPWQEGASLHTSSFSWLPYEPSWEAIVFARENGGCLSAELELKKKTIFSSNKEGKMSIGLSMFSSALEAGMALKNETDETYAVFVEFGKPVAQQA